MKIGDFLSANTKRLKAADISTARLDCLVLLEDESGKDRSWLLAHPERELQIETVQKLNKKVARRVAHEPLAYIRGKTEFYGREFMIDRRVLEPRPESETMIDMLKHLAKHLTAQPTTIADIGTGSGALAITAKLELPEATAYAIDIDPACLKVTYKNAQKLKADVTFLQGDLLSPLTSASQPAVTILLCNLPYVPDDFQINSAAMNEPRRAIFGGPDGLNLYRQLFKQIEHLPTLPRYILTEAMPPQHDKLAEIAQAANFKLTQSDDFIQLFSRQPN